MFLASAIAYTILQRIASRHSPKLAAAVGGDTKGRISLAIYAAGVALAFVHPLLANACYATVALIWLVPDRRIESRVRDHH